ncbi:hypothetical protein LAZ67_6002306, partial [Cordylochernes scorpioides]
MLFSLLSKLKNYDAHVPNIYGAPKAHKPNCPLRPIVNNRPSPTYALSKWLAQQLKIYQYFNENEIINSYEFKEDIIDMKLNGNQRIISLDVESMFTSIPIPTIMDALNHVIKESKINNLPKSEFLIGIEFYLKTTYFIYDDQIYLQMKGATMGSPISPNAACITIGQLEIKALNSLKNDGSEQKILDTFNNLLPDINYSMEVDNNKSINFLDMNLSYNNNNITTSIYKKPTHTGTYWNYGSQHHFSQKVGLDFGIPRNTLSTYLKNKEKILRSESECDKGRKRLREPGNPDLDKCVLKWFKQARDKKIPVSGHLIRSKAEQFATEMGKTNFKASSGWLDGFKERNKILFKTICGESGAVNLQVAEQWKNNLRLCKKAWDQVTSETIKHCFKKAGFVKKEEDEENADDIIAETMPSVDGWEDVISNPTISYDDFLNVDDDVAVCSEITDADIIAEVLNHNIEKQDGDEASGDEDESSVAGEMNVPSAAEATNYIMQLRRFFESKNDGRQALSEITFMQDGGPPHISRGAKQLLKDMSGENCGISRYFIYQWPPISSDLMPCDFWFG